MNLGGAEVVFEASVKLSEVVSVILSYWDDGVLEDVDTGVILRFEDLGERSEIFVFSDLFAYDSWSREGWTKEYASKMIYVIVGDVDNADDLGVILDRIRWAIGA